MFSVTVNEDELLISWFILETHISQCNVTRLIFNSHVAMCNIIQIENDFID